MRFVKDMHNNIGRRGYVPDSDVKWRIVSAMRDKDYGLHYVMRHPVTGERKAVAHRHIRNCY